MPVIKLRVLEYIEHDENLERKKEHPTEGIQADIFYDEEAANEREVELREEYGAVKKRIIDVPEDIQDLSESQKQDALNLYDEFSEILNP